MLSQFKKDEIAWELRAEDRKAGQVNKYNQPLPEQLIPASGRCVGCSSYRNNRCNCLAGCPFIQES